jgi:LAO/AO transport system kinase
MSAMSTTTVDTWKQQLLEQRPLALSRLISFVENHKPGYESLLDELYPHTGNTLRIGITGPPGAGKSTLVDQLARAFRAQDKTVGILACDPTSPFSGGALLGDRVRMHGVADDPGVFIRSIASRDALGGLSDTTNEVAWLFEAFGFDVVLLETVGVGQAEVDVMHCADTIVVAIVPQSGDVVQAMKAGLMEIADVFCINKADQPGADLAEQSLQQLLSFTMREWSNPIVQTVASQGKNIDTLRDAIFKHQEHLGAEGLAQRRQERLSQILRQGVEYRFRKNLWVDAGERLLENLSQETLNKQCGPYEAINHLLKKLST